MPGLAQNANAVSRPASATEEAATIRHGVIAQMLGEYLVRPDLKLMDPLQEHHDAAETTSPTSAAKTSKTRNSGLRISAPGSEGAAAVV